MAIADELIPAHHPEILGYPLRIVFRTPAPKSKGQSCWGTAEIVRGRFARFCMTADEKAMEGQEKGPRMFWMEISEDDWDTLNDRQRRALVDHELCHFEIKMTDEGPEMSIRPHDIEEFNEIVQRHGLWRDDLWEFCLTVAETVVPGAL